jgi:spore maturation protein B
MIRILTYISSLAVPLLIVSILVHGYIKGVKLYDTFVEGAKEGFGTSLRIMPYLIAIFLAIAAFRSSGAMDILISILSPLASLLGIPKEVLPLAIMKPISGSGSLAMVRDVLTAHGPDSFVGRVASTMMGSSETIFYTLAVYLGAVGIKKSGKALSCAMIAHFVGVIAAILICRVIFAD